MTERVRQSNIIAITPGTSILEVLPQLVSQTDQYTIYQIAQQEDTTLLIPASFNPFRSDHHTYCSEHIGSPAFAISNSTNEQTGVTVTVLSNAINRNLNVEADPWYITIMTNTDGAQIFEYLDDHHRNPNATKVTQDDDGQINANIRCPLESGEPVTYRYKGKGNFARIQLIDISKSREVIRNPVEMARIILDQLTQSPDLDRYMLARLTNQPNPYQHLNLTNHQTD